MVVSVCLGLFLYVFICLCVSLFVPVCLRLSLRVSLPPLRYNTAAQDPPFLIGRRAKRHHTVSPRRTHNKMIALNELLARPCGLTRYAAQASLSELSRVTRTAIWQARAKVRRRDTKTRLARSREETIASSQVTANCGNNNYKLNVSLEGLHFHETVLSLRVP